MRTSVFDFAPSFTTVYLSKINVYIIKESSLMRVEPVIIFVSITCFTGKKVIQGRF